MAEVLERNVLERWRERPLDFIEQVLRDPETGKPFELFPAQRQFFQYAWQRNDDGRLVFPEQCFGAPKKTGKTGTAAMHLLTTTCLFGGRFAEGYCVANDLEQAQGRVFQAVKQIVEASPYLKREVEMTQQRITFSQTGTVIQAIGSDYASAAGANPTISSFDELWGYTSERSYRLWDEMVPSPARKISCRLVTTYAGFEGESTLLENLYKRGLQQQQIAPNLYAGNGLLMGWYHEPQAPWQTEAWLAEMRNSLRPNQYLRMIENRFVTGEASFVTMPAWDRCVDPNLGPMPANKATRVYVGVDASVKHNSTAIVGVTWDRKHSFARLAFHRVFQPSPQQPLDFENTIEATLLDLNKRYWLSKVLFDPYQMQSTAQRLTKARLAIEEFPQSSPNLTAASQNLYELIQAQQLMLYPDANMRLAVSRAVAVETPRGWRISKATQSHKVDVIVALAMACHAAVTAQSDPKSTYDIRAFGGADDPEDPNGQAVFRRMQLINHLRRHGMPASLLF